MKPVTIARGFLVEVCLSAFLLVAGCSLLPETRVFQKKIPQDAGKPPAQLEAERRGAKFIAVRSASADADPAAQVAEIHAVAVPLSSSLGEPAKAVSVEDKDTIIAELRKGLIAQQRKADAWRAFALKYSGKEIEGTGIDLAAPGALLGVAGLVALFVFVPGALSVALFVIRRLRSTVQTMAQAVEEHATENPVEGKRLKQRVAAIGDKAHSKIIDRELKLIDWHQVRKKAARGAPQTV
jgi:hypothetical protein